MKYVLCLVVGSFVGYYAVTKLAPTVQAKFETLRLDEMWDVYSGDWAS